MPEGGQQQQQQQGGQQQGGQQQPWYQGVEGIDNEMVGHWTNAGWLNKSAAEIAREATKSWKAAERYVGAPPSELIRLPKDMKDEAGWNQVWMRLGKPKEAKEYDFSAIKFSDGTPIEEGFQNSIREAAYRLNIPKDAAAALMQEFTKYLDSAEQTEKTEYDAKLIAEKAALKKNWGPNEAANAFIADRAANALGVTQEDVKVLDGVLGYARVREMFRVIGTKIGEDVFVQGSPQSGNAIMTRDQAIARKYDLMSDPLWKKAYLAGDQAKAREMLALNSIITNIPVPA